MSGGSSANNSWTIVTPEETVAETLKPLVGGADKHEEILKSAAGPGDNNQPEGDAESADTLPVENNTVLEEKTAELNGDFRIDQDASEPSAATDNLIPSSLDHSDSSVHVGDEVSQTRVLPEEPPQISPDPDSFSDSYTHVTPSPDQPPLSLLSAETIGGGEFSPEEEKLPQLVEEKEPHQEEEESDQYSKTADFGKQTDSTTDPEVVDDRTEKTGDENEPEVRRRRSLLAALERIGRGEQEEAEEEEFRPPQRDDDSGFTVNKCILGAVILLGLGTIFFSESDYGTVELKDTVLPGKQEQLNPEVPPQPVDADNSQLLNKLAEGNEQISVLQAQLQAHKDELTVARGQAAEGAKERLRWEEVEKENTAIRTDETPVKPTTSPPSGQPEDSSPGTAGSQDEVTWKDQKKRDKHDMGEKREWKGKEKLVSKEGERREHKDGGKTERKSGRHEYEKEGKHKRQSDEANEWKKDKRGDEGKPWKNREGKRDWVEKSGKKEWMAGKERKDEKVNEGKKWRGQDENKEWKREKEWKKVKDGYKESGKEKWDKKEWKNKNAKDQGKEGKGRGERKQWEGGKNGKEWTGKDERKRQNEHEGKSKNGKHDKQERRKDERWEEWKKGGQKGKGHYGERKTDSSNSKSNKFPAPHGHKKEHLYGERKPAHTHQKPSMAQPEYWAQRKERLQHNPKPPPHCDSVESCAQAERLTPVPQPGFEALLQTYLTKAEEAGVEASKIEELRKLTPDFFKDGVFVHDQTSFLDFVEDLGDILEDMVEGEESDEEEEDSAAEDEMEGFEREVIQKFSLAGQKEKRMKGEWRKESGQGRG